MILHFSADTKKITLLAHVWLPWASLGGKPSKKSLKAHKTCSCFRVEEWAGYSCYPAKPVSGQRTLVGRWSAGGLLQSHSFRIATWAAAPSCCQWRSSPGLFLRGATVACREHFHPKSCAQGRGTYGGCDGPGIAAGHTGVATSDSLIFGSPVVSS